jgi:hypothetical protein
LIIWLSLAVGVAVAFMVVAVPGDTEPVLLWLLPQAINTQLRLEVVALAVQVGRLISVLKDLILYFPQSLQQVVDTAVQVALVA